VGGKMSDPDFVVVSLDDWQALYVNGEVVTQGHTLNLEHTINYVLEQHGMKPVLFKYGTPEFEEECHESGRLPDVIPEDNQLC
jgi:hypothetical protein